MKRILSIFRILSLDIVLGAVVGSMVLSNYFGASPGVITITTLGISVWVIYTLDHLIDAKRVKGIAHTSRHRFHQKHFKKVFIVWMIAAGTGLYMLTLLPVDILKWGIRLSIFVLLYFSLIQIAPRRFQVLKEPFAALLYTAGVFLPVLFDGNVTFTGPVTVVLIQYFLIAYLNLIIISSFEVTSDKADGFGSTVLLVRPAHVRNLISALLFVQFVLVAAGMYLGVYELEIVILLMTVSLVLVLYGQGYFNVNERYRSFSDAIFLYPAFLLL